MVHRKRKGGGESGIVVGSSGQTSETGSESWTLAGSVGPARPRTQSKSANNVATPYLPSAGLGRWVLSGDGRHGGYPINGRIRMRVRVRARRA